MKSTSKFNIISLLLLLGLSFILIFLTNRYILTVNFFERNETLGGLPQRNAEVYKSLQKWIYLSAALWLLFKLNIVALILHTALYLADQTVRYGRVFQTVVLSEYVFLIPAAFKLALFPHWYPGATLHDWYYCSVLSALSLFESASPDWWYPLQALSVFEAAYWFLLAYGLSRSCELNFDRSLRLVLLSYGPAFAAWLAIASLFSLLFFPA